MGRKWRKSRREGGKQPEQWWWGCLWHRPATGTSLDVRWMGPPDMKRAMQRVSREHPGEGWTLIEPPTPLHPIVNGPGMPRVPADMDEWRKTWLESLTAMADDEEEEEE